MIRTRSLVTAAIGLALAAGGLAAPASAQDRWDWHGGGPGDHRLYDLRGRGVPMLLPELRESPRGRAFVLRHFDFNRDGFISPYEANAANRAFMRFAGPDRGHFDWDARDRAMGPPPPPPPGRFDHDWDRQGMRAYHFRQNRYGAVFSIPDVLFRTGSAELRPEAGVKLRPLEGFLRANPGVRVRIDGYTDAVGSAQANLALSRARADSVAHALAEAGVDPGRLALYGHGEADPVASNASAAGRQLNRRVEVTLIGQQASAFD